MLVQRDTAMLGSSGYERNANDFYATEPPATRAIANLLKAQGILADNSTVWESACGNGKMVRVLEEHFSKVIATDIAPQMIARTLDFIKDEPDFGFDAIITNPPYTTVDEWIERCLRYVREFGITAAMLMRHELDCAMTRKRWFDACPEFAARLTLTWRPRWIEGSTGSPRHNYAWYIWRPGTHQPTNFYAFKADCK